MSPCASDSALFERPSLRAVTGDTIRPGGLALTDRAFGFCRLPAQSRVLDVGCGVGATVTHLRRKHQMDAFGIDSSAVLLREGRDRDPEIPFVRGTASSLPIGNEKLGALFCECVLSLLSDPLAVLEEFHRTLRPRGLLILTDLYVRSPEEAAGLRHLPFRSCLSGAMAQSQIENHLGKSGFRVLRWEDHSPLLKELAVRLIFIYGSLQNFWSGICASPQASLVSRAVRPARPGYYLLIAEKGVP